MATLARALEFIWLTSVAEEPAEWPGQIVNEVDAEEYHLDLYEDDTALLSLSYSGK